MLRSPLVELPRITSVGCCGDGYRFGVVIVMVEVDSDLGITANIKRQGFAVTTDVGEGEGLLPFAETGECEVACAICLDATARRLAVDRGVGERLVIVVGKEAARDG